jgi:hypothetical protein
MLDAETVFSNAGYPFVVTFGFLGTWRPYGVCVKQGQKEQEGCPRFAQAYLGRIRRGVPDLLFAALDATAYAAFFTESRMKCAGATKLHRKSGAQPHDRIG